MSAVNHSISDVERQLRVDEERLDSLENLKKVGTESSRSKGPAYRRLRLPFYLLAEPNLGLLNGID